MSNVILHSSVDGQNLRLRRGNGIDNSRWTGQQESRLPISPLEGVE
jgi:hypothetical protein